ncbi:sulfur carrier protein ThiS [Ehrlichia ruminantium]|uniref:Sulfur carrier protein ThiS n=1 Tax=Ehrlichia ruminantium TaxID=779 RepID=A0AAE6QAZ5_EHRRU|nr:sulfur carrier protein ThiS [Ehrlichia ruminantium]QGR02833.1 sulfur carrier protein ThiS [Ehrlichia ruminantium]QGR03757.1 sulfur carrier protein ThiS [Ehrlichia ruminantium]QGR04684.1 sulfur carrier protein ThiS [Ehrlichia ruminantium]
MITIIVNKEEKIFQNGLTLFDILNLCGYDSGVPFAVAVNKKLVVRGQYSNTCLNNGDVIDIVYPMQGG